MGTTLKTLKHKIVLDFNAAHDKKELLVYAVAWGTLLLATPLIELYDYVTKDAPIEMNVIINGWLNLLPFALIFIFNDLVLSRLIVKRHMVVQYVVCAIATAIIATMCIEFCHGDRHMGGLDQRERWENRIPAPRTESDMPFLPPEPPEGEPDEMAPPFPEEQDDRIAEDNFRKDRHNDRFGNRIGDKNNNFRRRFFRGPMVGNFAIAMMTLFLGVIVKIYNLAERDKERLRHVSYEKTKAELAQLKYQLSPHFMMNTLNNIHALVDIDSEKAKQTIEQMSHLMRYVLYESNKELVDLSSEISFLKNYVELMKIRYTSSVSITVNIPNETYGIKLPPLLFINMVENAFKHGISYSNKSFVDIQMSISESHDCINFCCTNSLGSGAQDAQHGIGLTNVRKRLDLICPGKYQLSAVELADRYVATLSLNIG